MIRVQRVTSVLSVTLLAALSACAEGPTISSGGGGEIGSSKELVAVPMLPVLPGETRQLLFCPPGAVSSTSETFGKEGGTLRVGGHELRIPPGAVREPTTFTANSAAGPLLALQFGYSGGAISLDRPLVARISYARCPRQDLAGRRLTVVSTGDSGDLRLEAAAAGMLEVGGIDDAFGALVEVEIRERGTYAVAY